MSYLYIIIIMYKQMWSILCSWWNCFHKQPEGYTTIPTKPIDEEKHNDEEMSEEYLIL